jgi:hypothetical protein
VFELFDQVIVLQKGQLAYHGPAALVRPYFIHQGLPLSAVDSTPDGMLDAVQQPEHEATILGGFRPVAMAEEIQRPQNTEAGAVSAPSHLPERQHLVAATACMCYAGVCARVELTPDGRGAA